MRNFLLATGLLIAINLSAQTGTYYVAAKTGLSIREKADANAKVLDKIPYGTKITVIQDNADPKPISTDGLSGYWQKVKYNNKTGYIVGSYLFSAPPPKAGTKDLKGYLAQVTQLFGARLIVKSGSLNNIEEGGWELRKQLYKNGAEWHEFLGYEYGSNTYYLPEFDLQQGFLLLRLIPEFGSVFGEKDLFPSASRTFKKGENEYSITVEKEMLGDNPWYKKISIEFTDGAVYNFEMYMQDNQLVIFMGSGV